jgi:phosphoribosylaminoimidazole (AIR) synthetase
MRHVFNLGVGMIMIVHPDHADTVLGATRDEGSFVLGHIVTA